MANEGTSGTDLEDRMTRLEEAGAFSERTVEQLNSEMVAFNRRMSDVLMRLDRLEGRLERLMGSVTELAASNADSEASVPPPPDDPHRPAGQPPVD